MVDLNNKVVLVTGAASGIGFAIARGCLQAGAQVAVHARSEVKADEAVELLKDKNAKPVYGDLSAADSAKDIIGQVLNHFGSIDGLVNNAGIFPRNDIDSVTHDNFDDIINVNLRAPLFLVKEFVDCKKGTSNSSGSIINIGSINAHCGQSDLLVYSMSKGALQTMTRNLSNSLSYRKIRINQINVGWTHTDKEHEIQIAEGRPHNWHENIPKVAAPFGHILQPEQIAEHAVFWLSDASYPVSGQCYECEQYPLIGRNELNTMEL